MNEEEEWSQDTAPVEHQSREWMNRMKHSQFQQTAVYRKSGNKIR